MVEAKEVFQAIQVLNDCPLVEGVIPAEFGDNLTLTPREKNILNHLPVFGSSDKRLEDILVIYQQIQGIMHQPPHSSEAQVVAGKLYRKALELFENDAQLLDKYWGLIRPEDDGESVVIGMDAGLMSYIDEMIIFFLNQREEGENEEM